MRLILRQPRTERGSYLYIQVNVASISGEVREGTVKSGLCERSKLTEATEATGEKRSARFKTCTTAEHSLSVSSVEPVSLVLRLFFDRSIFFDPSRRLVLAGIGTPDRLQVTKWAISEKPTHSNGAEQTLSRPTKEDFNVSELNPRGRITTRKAHPSPTYSRIRYRLSQYGVHSGFDRLPLLPTHSSERRGVDEDLLG